MMRSDSAFGVPSTVSKALPGNCMWIALLEADLLQPQPVPLVRSLSRNPHRQQLHSAAAAILQKTLLVGPTPREHLVPRSLCRTRGPLAPPMLPARASPRQSRRLLLIHSKTLPPTAFTRAPYVQIPPLQNQQEQPDKQDGLTGLTGRLLWSVVEQSTKEIGIERFGAHDLRRTCAKLCRKAGGDLEQIKFLLGHSSIQTTKRYLGSEQEIVVAVNDILGL